MICCTHNKFDKLKENYSLVLIISSVTDATGFNLFGLNGTNSLSQGSINNFLNSFFDETGNI